MNIFDILGPIMIGPSSSHTAAVVRIGNIIHKIIGTPQFAEVYFHGSFAQTYQGHGSDRAIVGGMLGFTPDDERIVDSLSLAKQEGLHVTFQTIVLDHAHPNSVLVNCHNTEKLSIVGESIGGGNIIIRNINGIELEFTGQLPTLLLTNEDKPGVVKDVSQLMFEEGMNIASMKLHRSGKHEVAIQMMELDSLPSENLRKKIEALPHVLSAKIIPSLV